MTDIVAYSTKNAKVFATGHPIILSSFLGYAISLTFSYFNRSSLAYDCDNIPSLYSHDNDDLTNILPISTNTLYTNRSFLTAASGFSSSMSSAWMALDNDNFILESSSKNIPTIYPSVLCSEVVTLLSAIRALSPNSSITIYTNCASIIAFWHKFVDKPFLLKLLRQPNHLLWLSIRDLIQANNLSITLFKVPAYNDNPYNNQIDSLAKGVHFFPQPSTSLMAYL